MHNVDNLKDSFSVRTSYVHLQLQKLALTLPTSGGRSVGIVRSRTKATALLLNYYYYEIYTRLQHVT
jgi:hypothetical protein